MMKIPRIKLKVGTLLFKADQHNDLYTYESELPGTAFITDGKDILIITSERGYLRLPGERLEKLIGELRTIKDDNDRFR